MERGGTWLAISTKMKREFEFIYKQIAECGTAVGWTYKIQLKQAEVNTTFSRRIKWASVILSAIVSVSAISAALKIFNISDELADFITALIGIFATAAIGLDNKLDYLTLAKDNIKCGAVCRDITKSYRSLLTDIKSGVLQDYDEIVKRRDELQRQELELFSSAPITFQRALKKAEKRLMEARDNQTSEIEIRNVLGDSYILNDDDFED